MQVCPSIGLNIHIIIHMRIIIGMRRSIFLFNISISVTHIRTCLNISATMNINTGIINVSISIRRSINTYVNIDVSIHTGIFINTSIN